MALNVNSNPYQIPGGFTPTTNKPRRRPHPPTGIRLSPANGILWFQYLHLLQDALDHDTSPAEPKLYADDNFAIQFALQSAIRKLENRKANMRAEER